MVAKNKFMHATFLLHPYHAFNYIQEAYNNTQYYQDCAAWGAGLVPGSPVQTPATADDYYRWNDAYLRSTDFTSDMMDLIGETGAGWLKVSLKPRYMDRLMMLIAPGGVNTAPAHVLTDAEVSDAGWDALDVIVQKCRKYGMHVLFCLHYPYIENVDDSSYGYLPTYYYQPLCTHLANRYVGYADIITVCPQEEITSFYSGFFDTVEFMTLVYDTFKGVSSDYKILSPSVLSVSQAYTLLGDLNAGGAINDFDYFGISNIFAPSDVLSVTSELDTYGRTDALLFIPEANILFDETSEQSAAKYMSQHENFKDHARVAVYGYWRFDESDMPIPGTAPNLIDATYTNIGANSYYGPSGMLQLDKFPDLVEWYAPRQACFAMGFMPSNLRSVKRTVAAGLDDCYYQAIGDGFVNNSSSVYVGSYLSNPMSCWFRFLDIAIPRGARVVSAWMTVRGNGNETGDSAIYESQCIDEDNTADFTNNPVTRDLTTGKGPLLKVRGNYTTNYKKWSIDVTIPVAEVLGRSGWASGNALAVVLNPNPTNQVSKYFSIRAYESGSDMAYIEIRYKLPKKAHGG